MCIRDRGYGVAMDREGGQAWLDRYVAAWRSYDREEIADLSAPTSPTGTTRSTSR